MISLVKINLIKGEAIYILYPNGLGCLHKLFYALIHKQNLIKMSHFRDILGWSLAVCKTDGNISRVINLNYRVYSTGHSNA